MFFILLTGLTLSAQAQQPSLMQAGVDALNSALLSDAQVVQLSRQAVQQMDAQNPVAGPNDPYSQRLNRIVRRHKNSKRHSDQLQSVYGERRKCVCHRRRKRTGL